MKAIRTPAGYLYLDRPPVFPSLTRSLPALDLRAGFADWMTGQPL